MKESIITCDPNALTLQVPKCAFENINFDWSKAYLAGPDKTPQLDGNDLNPCTGVENGNEVVFRNCGPHKITFGSKSMATEIRQFAGSLIRIPYTK